ncbi:MAG: hypothetical protein KGH93_02695 [Patescibacteria group bacterium]|nr:hypothetical protein [Patescibacteria group bacterium]
MPQAKPFAERVWEKQQDRINIWYKNFPHFQLRVFQNPLPDMENSGQYSGNVFFVIRDAAGKIRNGRPAEFIEYYPTAATAKKEAEKKFAEMVRRISVEAKNLKDFPWKRKEDFWPTKRRVFHYGKHMKYLSANVFRGTKKYKDRWVVLVNFTALGDPFLLIDTRPRLREAKIRADKLLAQAAREIAKEIR